MKEAQSLNSKAIRRFKSNKTALLGLCILGVSLLIALLAYFIAADGTPNGNNQIVQIKTSSPNFEILILRDTKDESYEKNGFFKQLSEGQPSHFIDIPITKYTLEGPLVKYFEYRGEETNPIPKQKEIIDILYPLSLNQRKINFDGKEFSFMGFDEKPMKVSLAEATQAFQQHIEKRKFRLGTDSNGRDVLSRLIIGSRVSFSVGLISVLISLLIGITLGAMAGYFRGWVDELIMWLINVFWAIPTVLLAMGLMISIDTASGSRIWMVYIAVG